MLVQSNVANTNIDIISADMKFYIEADVLENVTLYNYLGFFFLILYLFW